MKSGAQIEIPLESPDFHKPPCREKPELFFSWASSELYEAQQICMSCPYLKPCDDWATKNNERHGMWGGKLRSYPSSNLYKDFVKYTKLRQKIERELERKMNGRPLQ